MHSNTNAVEIPHSKSFQRFSFQFRRKCNSNKNSQTISKLNNEQNICFKDAALISIIKYESFQSLLRRGGSIYYYKYMFVCSDNGVPLCLLIKRVGQNRKFPTQSVEVKD